MYSSKCIAFLVVFLSAIFTACYSGRISDANSKFLKRSVSVQSVSIPSYRKLTKRSADCAAILDSPQNCPYVNHTPVEGKSAQIRSTSPWINEIDTDPARVPQSFSVVCCSCINCIDMTTGVPKAMTNHFSEAIYVKKEIRRIDEGFRPRYIKVAVGCTCVYRPPFASLWITK